MDDGDWIEGFDGLRELPPALRADLVRGARRLVVTAGTHLFEPGQSPDSFLLLLKGTVLVQQHSRTGRDVALYRVHAGESCVLTTACMLAFEDYSADGVAETDIEAIAIPRRTFDDLAARSPIFREFIFKAYARRITELFSLIDDIVFQRMDVRLAARLLELAGRSAIVEATHQALATELGTAREVVSRTLAEFQRRGWVEQARGEIRLLQRQAMERLARSADEV